MARLDLLPCERLDPELFAMLEAFQHTYSEGNPAVLQAANCYFLHQLCSKGKGELG